MSELVGKSAKERNEASVTLDILASTKNKTAAEPAVEVVTESENQWTVDAVRNTCRINAGRTKVVEREDTWA